ncbi:hypothetical protein GCM10009001_30740 [Virgibacillus siamensis]|uniref:Uncharacterized protein n=1 Tax=Virgibacillus siamensis TaxID=480071 RepID=A0ABN1GGZ3_9BACI
MEPSKMGPMQSLRVLFPDLYQFVVNHLEETHNIHPYDVQAHALKDQNGYQLIFHFGEGYAHEESKFFTLDSIKNMDAEIKEFTKTVGEKCKEVMIADYFKMMKM